MVHLEFNGITFHIADILFIRAEMLDIKKDCLAMRVSMQLPGEDADPKSVDALIRLDIESYVPTLDGSHLMEILAKSYDELPHTLKEYPAWYRSLGD